MKAFVICGIESLEVSFSIEISNGNVAIRIELFVLAFLHLFNLFFNLMQNLTVTNAF